MRQEPKTKQCDNVPLTKAQIFYKNNIINLSFKTIKCHYAISYFFKRLFVKDFSFKSKTRRKPGVWYGFQKPALVLANDVILLATPCLSEDCTKCVQWIESQLSASQPMFSDYELRLSSYSCALRVSSLFVRTHPWVSLVA